MDFTSVTWDRNSSRRASKSISDQLPLTVVDLVLDDLGCPAGEGLKADLELLVLVLHFDGFPAFCLSGTGEGETTFLRLVRPGFLDDLRVKHHHIFALVVKDNNPFVDADHVGCHAHTTVDSWFCGRLWCPAGLGQLVSPPDWLVQLFERGMLHPA